MPRILYVEDDPNLGFVTKDNLELNHYEIVHCVDGQEALATFSEQQPFDMCVLDVMLPLMDGFTLAKKIREQDKHVPILFLTARALQEDKLHGLRIGPCRPTRSDWPSIPPTRSCRRTQTAPS